MHAMPEPPAQRLWHKYAFAVAVLGGGGGGDSDIQKKKKIRYRKSHLSMNRLASMKSVFCCLTYAIIQSERRTFHNL